MKKKWKLGMLLTLLLVFVMQMTVMAAGESVTINYCYIEGDQVIVIGSGAVAASDDGNYYLFALKPYEAGVGARTDYCASAPAAELVQFTTPLGLDTAASKLYSRFVVTALRGGAFVPVSTEMYITNPEAVAKASTKSIAEATGNKKGLYCGWQYAQYLSDLGAGYVASVLNTADFFNGGGVNYTYNGKTYQFNAQQVQSTDILVRLYNAQNVDIVMTIVNGYNAANADMVYPEALTTGKHPNYYAFNVENPSGEEKLEAFMSFISERYSGGQYGSIHNYVIGNEVNSSDSWHYAGEISVDEFAVKYAKQFRVCYNAIKSHNMGANVYICTDQRWLHNDGGSSYGGKPVLDGFNAEILRTGNINWGLSFHPYPAPLANTNFWTDAPGYGPLRLVDHTENTKMITPLNMEVVTNYMQKPEYLAPSGAVRNIFISELGFSSMSTVSPGVDEGVQAAALVYAFKLIQANPYIKGVAFNSVIDNDFEVANDKLAVGLMRSDTAQKPAYSAFQNMDKANMDHFLPYIGASSWAQLGVQ
ncbi:MAG: hypothetical protein K2N95_15275 [Lachnospiraceae bacterium]|nr:hypothetical protein [Lachnospiraceae bacterium]